MRSGARALGILIPCVVALRPLAFADDQNGNLRRFEDQLTPKPSTDAQPEPPKRASRDGEGNVDDPLGALIVEVAEVVLAAPFFIPNALVEGNDDATRSFLSDPAPSAFIEAGGRESDERKIALTGRGAAQIVPPGVTAMRQEAALETRYRWSASAAYTRYSDRSAVGNQTLSFFEVIPLGAGNPIVEVCPTVEYRWRDLSNTAGYRLREAGSEVLQGPELGLKAFF